MNLIVGQHQAVGRTWDAGRRATARTTMRGRQAGRRREAMEIGCRGGRARATAVWTHRAYERARRSFRVRQRESRATAVWTHRAFEPVFGGVRRRGIDEVPTLARSRQRTSGSNSTDRARAQTLRTRARRSTRTTTPPRGAVVLWCGSNRIIATVGSDAAQLAVAPERAHRRQFSCSSAVVRAR